MTELPAAIRGTACPETWERALSCSAALRCAQAGLLVQNVVTFAVAYLIAFSAGWRMTLVITASIPLMVVAGGVQASVMTGFTSKARGPA